MLRRFLSPLLALFIAAAAPAQSSSSIFNEVDRMLGVLSRITGWKVRRHVPAEILSKERFRTMVEKRIRETVKPEEIRAEDLTLKMFGLVPRDFDLAKTTVDLVSEQAAAFYDYNHKRLYILDTTTNDADQRLALVHELAHALADQNWPIGRYMNQGSPSDDSATARQAVVEGQATWLMWAFVSVEGGGKAEVPRTMLNMMMTAAGVGAAQYPVFAKAPLYMRESLLFPYTYGMAFQDAVFRKLGQRGFDEVFRKPPVSSQQILHPEKYFGGVAPTHPAPPALPRQRRDYRKLAEGSVGEFDHSVLLRQYVGEQEATALSPFWRGGEYRLFEDKQSKRPALSYVSQWDSPGSARHYFELYRKVLRGKWKNMEVTSESAGELRGVGDSGRFVVRLDNDCVSSLEGLR